MPRESEKQVITRWLLSRLEREAIKAQQISFKRYLQRRIGYTLGSGTYNSQDTWRRRSRGRIRQALQMIVSMGRYMESRAQRVPKSLDWYETIIGQLSLHRFRHFFRMNPDSVFLILSKIERHPVFHNNSRHNQVQPQFCITIPNL